MNDPNEAMSRGEELFHAGNMKDARKVFEQLILGDPLNYDNVVKKPKTAIVIPRSLRRGISIIRYYDTFRFTKRSLAALGMTNRIFYEGILYLLVA